MISMPGVLVSERFLDDERMSDWQRLGKYVVARREELGYKQRGQIASAVGVSTRVMSDIENGRRGNFDQVTVAALERVLGWETGSAARVAAGGEPVIRGQASTDTPTRPMSAQEFTEMIDEIEASPSLEPLEKLHAIRKVLRIYRQAEAQVAEGRGQAFDATVETSRDGNSS